MTVTLDVSACPSGAECENSHEASTCPLHGFNARWVSPANHGGCPLPTALPTDARAPSQRWVSLANRPPCQPTLPTDVGTLPLARLPTDGGCPLARSTDGGCPLARSALARCPCQPRWVSLANRLANRRSRTFPTVGVPCQPPCQPTPLPTDLANRCWHASLGTLANRRWVSLGTVPLGTVPTCTATALLARPQGGCPLLRPPRVGVPCRGPLAAAPGWVSLAAANGVV